MIHFRSSTLFFPCVIWGGEWLRNIFCMQFSENIKFVYVISLQRTDSSYLAQFFHSDEELNMVASELDSFDGRKDPERCNALVNQLRMCQDKVSFSAN